MWVNLDDIIQQLVDHGFQMPKGGWEAGVDCGKRSGVRTKVDGCSQLGFYKLFTISLDDGRRALVGSFGWWKGGDEHIHKFKLTIDGKTPSMSPEAKAALKARMESDRKAAEAMEKARKAKAARVATLAWGKCTPDGASDYLKRKQVGAHDVRFSPQGNLVIPMRDNKGGIHGLQVIYSVKKNGRDKDFWPAGLAKKGHYHLIGGAPVGAIVIAEGYATAASIHEAIKLPVAVAFDAGNLMPVAQSVQKRWPTTKIIIAADDDYRTEGNPGVKHAEAAALAVNGSVVIPQFAAERPADTKGPTDFNDLHVIESLGVVTAQLEAHLAGKRITVQQPAARGSAGQPGGGEKRERRAAQSVMDLQEIVERFVPLDDGTGDYVFDTWTNKVAKKSQMLALLPAGVRGDDIKRHPLWITRGACYLDQVGFDPSEKDSAVKLNTWQGWPMKPAAGKCDTLLELIAYLCGKESNGSEVYEWLLNWMAYPLQNPGAKMASAVIMHGPQGTGKSTIFQTLAKIYGDYSTVLNQRGLEDKFNSDWSDSKLFILAEEVVTRAEMWHIKNELKELVTGEWIRINPKNVAAYRQRNQVNIAYLSNENQPLPLDNDDRRHLVIYTPPALSEAFYDDVNIELEQGGTAAFYDFLLRRDLSGFHPKKRPPMTEAKKKLIALSMASELRFVNDWITGDAGLPVCPCLSGDLYAAYLRWCRINGESRPRPSNQFFGAIEHQQGWEKKKARLYLQEMDTSTVAKPVIFPPDTILQAIDVIGDDGKPAQLISKRAGRETVWLGECVRRFSDAVGSDNQRAAA